MQDFQNNNTFNTLNTRSKSMYYICAELLNNSFDSKASVLKLFQRIENEKIFTKDELITNALDIIEMYIEFTREIQNENHGTVLTVSNGLFEYLKIPSPKRIYYIIKILLVLRDKLLASSVIGACFYISIIKLFLEQLLSLKTLKSEDVRFLYYTVIERIMFLKDAELLFGCFDLFTQYVGKTTKKRDNLNIMMIPIRFLLNILPYNKINDAYNIKCLTLINYLLKEKKNIEILNEDVILECSDSLYLHIFSNIFEQISDSYETYKFTGIIGKTEYDLGLILQYLKLCNTKTIGFEFMLLNYISEIMKFNNPSPDYYKIIKQLNKIKNTCKIETAENFPISKQQTNEQKIYNYITESMNDVRVHKLVKEYSPTKSSLKRVELHNYEVLVFSFFQYVMENEGNHEFYLISYVIHSLTAKRVTLPEDYSDLLNFTIIKYADKPGSFKEQINEKIKNAQEEGNKTLKMYLEFGVSLYNTLRLLNGLKNKPVKNFKLLLLGNFKERMLLDILSNVFVNFVSDLYLMKYVDFVQASLPVLDFFRTTNVDDLQSIRLASECINNVFMLFIQPIDTTISGSDFLNVGDLVAIKLNSRSSIVNDNYLQRNSILIFLKKLLASFEILGWAKLNLQFKRYYWALYLAEMYVIYEKILDNYDFTSYKGKDEYLQIRMACEKKIFRRLLTGSPTIERIETLRLEYKIKEEDGKYLPLWFNDHNPPIMKNYIYRETYTEQFVNSNDTGNFHKILANFVFVLGEERNKNRKFVSENTVDLSCYLDMISATWERIRSMGTERMDLFNELLINSFISTLRFKVNKSLNNTDPTNKEYIKSMGKYSLEYKDNISGELIKLMFQDVLDILKKPIYCLILEDDFKNIDTKYQYLSRLSIRNIQLLIFYSKTFMSESENRSIISNLALVKILNHKLKAAAEFLFNPFWKIKKDPALKEATVDSSQIFNMQSIASLLWNRREFSKAIEVNFKIVTLLKKSGGDKNATGMKLLAISNTILAIRSFEKQSISYEDCDELFKQSVTLLVNNEDHLMYFVKNNYKIFLSQLLNKKEKLFQSSEWLRKRELIKQKKNMIEKTREKYKGPSRNASRAETEFYSVLSTATSELKAEIIKVNNETSKQENDKVKLAELMCECIILEKENISQMIFELINLWFENQNKITSLTSTIYNYVLKDKKTISFHKLIPVIKQLVSKLSTLNAPLRHDKKDSFSSVLYKICLGVISQHPFQTIQLFIPLRDKNKHCQDLLENLLMTSHGKYIKMYVDTADFYIALTEDTFKKKLQNGKVVCMSSKMDDLARKLKGSILYTADIPVNKDSSYNEEVLLPHTLVSINKEMQTSPSGITRPLILKVKTSDGENHKQLLKSNDDMRQDSCVQLLFKSLNKFIPFNQIRTYNAFPINSSVGVIQWLNDVVSYSRYIDAAQKVYKGKPNELRAVHERMRKTTSKAKLLDNYKDILKKLKPTMRYFFLENFNTPKSYITARHNYLTSTAVASLVGYIVGIGDRHNENIMIDKATGETVHIDFGVMFCQGEALKIPEKVPFRLTPEMNDSLGVLTVNSGFKIYMEETLKSLKNNKQIVMTVLKVLTNDPINRWMLSNKIIQEKVSKYRKIKLSVNNRQDFKFTTTGGDNLNINAEQMLGTVNDKLDGNVDFVHYSTSGVVNKLIVDATNFELLSQMYCGWAAWL
eukprot:GAHX01002240.1.p1 GENE.GAHX01002240.1~~GAHX01002240.1.p1  ORF type:complete len:1681 (+),score=253.18 GAHX01002240.1:37-5079(+)